MKNNKGITLIAMVVTIVILLILAGVSIAALTRENGIIKQAQESKERTKYEGAKEKFNLVILDVRSKKLEKNEKFLVSDSLVAEIQSYKEIELATLVEDKIEVIVDGYTFEVIGEAEKKMINFTIDEQEYVTEKGTIWLDFAKNGELTFFAEIDNGLGFPDWDTFGGNAVPVELYLLCMDGNVVEIDDEIIDGKGYLVMNSGKKGYTFSNFIIH